MNARNNYGFQQPAELCKQTHQEIPQTMSAKCRVDGNNYSNDFLPRCLKKAKSAFDSQACACRSRLTEDEIGQQSADQFPWVHIIDPYTISCYVIACWKLWGSKSELITERDGDQNMSRNRRLQKEGKQL